jgi:uncharacterized protein YktB (UPF0637 family)
MAMKHQSRSGAAAEPPVDQAPPAQRAELFQVFEIPDFEGRMTALRAQVSPWLAQVGTALAPSLAELAGGPIYPHVALHARRTVNPPEDTWVAFGPRARGYKAERHFKVAVSGGALRFLFEIGPEYEGKAAWAKRWRSTAPSLRPRLASSPTLAWFEHEHQEAPASLLTELSAADFVALADRLEKKRDGQLVLGVAIPRREALRLDGKLLAAEAGRVFGALAHGYRLAER